MNLRRSGRSWMIHFQLWIGIALLGACDAGNDPVEQDRGYDYFPLVIGQYKVYQVDSSYYRSNIFYPVNYFLKVKTIESAVSQEGGITYVLSLEKRTAVTNPWIRLATYSARISDDKAILAEGNTSYVKLLLPPQEGLRWNGNSFNTLGGAETCSNSPCDLYAYQDVGKRYTLSSTMDFENTISIEQQNSVDPIVGDDVRKEVYAKGVGLVYKESRVLKYCTEATRNCVGKKFIDSGFTYKLTIIEYGQE